jgi:hypothetical protein
VQAQRSDFRAQKVPAKAQAQSRARHTHLISRKVCHACATQGCQRKVHGVT